MPESCFLFVHLWLPPLFFGFLCSFWLLGLGSSLTICVLRNAYLGSLVGRGSLYLNQLSPEWRSLSLKAVLTLGLVRGLTGREWPLFMLVRGKAMSHF